MKLPPSPSKNHKLAFILLLSMRATGEALLCSQLPRAQSQPETLQHSPQGMEEGRDGRAEGGIFPYTLFALKH